MSSIRVLHIAPGSATLTPEQKRFNTLIRQIEQARATLTAWQENIALYSQAYNRVIVPLKQSLDAARRDWAFALDGLLNQPGWTKQERATLAELLCHTVGALLSEAGDDADLKALFDKHSDVDFDTEMQNSRAALKEMMEAVTGIDLGDDDEGGEPRSDEEMLRRMHERLAAAAAAETEREAQARERGASGRRKKPNAAQQRREADAQLATQSVREIFRKLASALHPDRETDPAERDAKTALMQKVNQAYAANDLLALLEMQLQIEQVDADHLAGATPQRLKHYNKVLAEQLAELKAEAARVEDGFRMDFDLESGWGLNPAKLGVSISAGAQQLRAELALEQRELRMFADKPAVKRWLKRERQRLREAEFDDGLF